MAEKLVLVLGCGQFPSGNAINHDLTKHRPEVDVAWDLNRLPWPWPDEAFTNIVARAVFEHLHITLFVALNETWRIMKPGGVLDIKIPYWRSETSYDDATHEHVFGLHVFDQFDPSTRRGDHYGFYGAKPWKILSCGLNRCGSSVMAKLEKLAK